MFIDYRVNDDVKADGNSLKIQIDDREGKINIFTIHITELRAEADKSFRMPLKLKFYAIRFSSN
jgi:hypothetical protein